MTHLKKQAVGLILVVLVFPLCARAGVLRGWFGGTGSWQAPGNWNPPGVPADGDDVVVATISPTDVLVGDNDNSFFVIVLNSLLVDSNGAGHLFLTQGGNTPLRATRFTLGGGGAANYAIANASAIFGSGSMNNASVFTVSAGSTLSCGTFTQNNGFFNNAGLASFSSNYTMNGGSIGSSGTFRVAGNFVQGNAAVNAASLSVGGTYIVNAGNFTGSASVGSFTDNLGGDFGGDIEILNHLTFSGNGSFEGNVINHATYVQPAMQSFYIHKDFTQMGGVYTQSGNLNGHSLTAIGSESNLISIAGGAQWTHQGGLLQGNVILIGAAETPGIYHLGGTGFVNCNQLAVGFLGDGTATQNAGSITSLSLDLGGTRGLFRGGFPTPASPHGGYYDLSGGSIDTGILVVGDLGSLYGIYNQSGGSIHSDQLEINVNSTSTGIVNLSGGTFDVGTTTAINNGSFNQSGGVAIFDTEINGAGSLSITGTGSMTIKRVIQNSLFVGGSGNLFISALNGIGTIGSQGTPTTSRLKSLTFEQVGSTIHGTLNLKNSRLIVDYDPGTASPLANVRNEVISGYATGAWNGTGISSSSARLDATHRTGLGYAEASQIFGASGGVFGGMFVDGTAVLVKFTYYGDANLDGQVDVTDLGALATNWQGSANWRGGDFNYDGVVNVSDLGLLATNWQAGVGNPLGPSLADALATVGLGATSVPEPALIGLAALALVAGSRIRPPR